LCAFGFASAALADQPDPDRNENWRKVRAAVFKDQPIAAQGGDVIALDAPQRAADGAVVPIAIRAKFPQSDVRYIEKIWLVVDQNPSPLGATFTFTPASGRADIETRIRLEEYSHVRAIAQTNDGKLYMATSYVKAAGGCSAPAGKDAELAKANMGKMKLIVENSIDLTQPLLGRLMISHPNDSGLAMDQVTRLYAPPHFVRGVEIKYGGKLVLTADIDFTISENPNFRFYFDAHDKGELEAFVIDNLDNKWSARTTVGGEALAKK
jgi:sulfur-oxidizing protein SoxY